MPASRACLNKRSWSCRLVAWNTPPMRAQPRPISETVRSVLPKRRYNTANAPWPGHSIALQIVGEAVRGSCRQRHHGKRRVLFDAGREAAGVRNDDVIHIVEPTPLVEHAIPRRLVHAGGAAIMGRPTGRESVCR